MSDRGGATDWTEAPGVVLFASTIDGSNVFYDGIVQHLRRARWRVHVASSPGETAWRIFGDDATIHKLEMRREISPLADLRSLVGWLRLLADVRPDVLVIGTPKASLLGGLAGRLMRVKKIVYVAHGLRAETSSGLFGVLLKAMEAITLRLAHNVVAVSVSLRRAIEVAHPSMRGYIDVVGYGSINGVDKARFLPASPLARTAARAAQGVPMDCFVMGFVGRLNEDKGGRFLLDLMDRTLIRELNVHLLVIGELQDSGLKHKVDRLSSEGRLTVTGWVERPELAMAAMDILVHPTLREGLGMVLLEAQLMGIPVVTNRVTGTTDAMHDGVGGYFAATNSVDDWTRVILALAESVGVRESLGESGRAFVCARFDRKEVVVAFARYVAASPVHSHRAPPFSLRLRRRRP